jgi:hypothetical protein
MTTTPTPPPNPLTIVKGARTLRAWFQQNPAFNQVWLAGQVGVTRSYISMLSSGNRGASGRVAKRIRRVTGVPVDTLVTKNHKRGPPARGQGGGGGD